MSLTNQGLRVLRTVAVVGAVCAASAARADLHIPVYTGTPLMIASGVVTQQTLNRSIDAAHGSARPVPPRAAEVSTRIAVAGRSDVPARMAAGFPAAGRAEAERTYREMLEKHPQLMQQLGVPSYDVAAAMATFVAGVYIAWRDVDFPDRNFRPLYEQLRGIVASQPAFAKADGAERREMYERLAILGTFLALTREALKQRPDAQTSARLREAAREYLRQFMQADVERLRITERGMVLN